MKHTPGPWVVTVDGGSAIIKEVNGTGSAGYRCTICQISERSEYLTDRDKANAHLIAAAPEMLEALEDLVKDMQSIYASEYRGFRVPDEDPSLISYINLIKKAKGE